MKSLTSITYNLKPTRGFTLIELLVAIGLFSVVVAIASGTFVRVLKSQRAATELISMNDNTSLTLEMMAREMRTSTKFTQRNSNEVRFKNAFGKNIVYWRNDINNAIEKSIDGGSFERLTATNVVVKKFVVVLSGVQARDGKQSRITIGMEVGGRSKALEEVVTRLQTTISPRTIDS